MPVIKGTRGRGQRSQGQDADIVDASHPAGFSKIRCHACKVGMAEQRLGSDGKPEFYCARCHRSFRVSSI